MLLPVLDASDIGSALLLVMIRADGALAGVATPQGESATISVMTDIATGLQQLHSIGIIHRDLKPANVLLHDRRWKLADFGIARDQEIGTQDPTFIGWGSPPYMAPEIWEGKSPTVKTDLYALGCLGFELLAGTPPYAGDQATIRAGHLTQTPPNVPANNITLTNLITRLLAKNPGDRPQDARAVLDRLNRAPIPRTPVQEAIVRGLGVHVREKAQADAERASAEEAAQTHRQHVIQAKADLREILNDALEELQAIEPDATLRTEPSGSLTLSTADARLRIDFWEQNAKPQIPGDTMVAGGCVIITNHAYPTELNCANIVYELIGDRLGWQVYRFRSGMVPSSRYEYGPYGRTHGLDVRHFLDPRERQFMLKPVMHVWRKTTATLTAEAVLELFQEAVDLRPPDSRTGIWSGAR